MKTTLLSSLAALAVLAAISPAGAATIKTLNGEKPVLIAHRGASGYLPEHTLAGYELGIKMGADYIEPDLQMTADGVAVVMHDGTLNRTTNVEALFAPRNGGYKVSDFTLAEIKTLTVEPTRTAGTEYPGFTPSMANPFQVPTFEEVLDWLSAKNAADGTQIGVYPESKTPYDAALNAEIIRAMQAHGYTDAADKVILQSFSFQAAAELDDLLDQNGMEAVIAQLGYATLQDGVFGVTSDGGFRTLEEIAGYADGLGMSLGGALGADFVSAAHDLGLAVHVWTFRPTSLDQAMAQMVPVLEWGVDGIFTDYADLGRAVIDTTYPTAVPVPAALPLALAGIGAIGALRLRRRAA